MKSKQNKTNIKALAKYFGNLLNCPNPEETFEFKNKIENET